MRRLFLMLSLCFSLFFAMPLIAQSDIPKNLVPLPEIPELPELSPDSDLPELAAPPPLPPDMEIDPDLEPQITIIKRGEDTIEEHRINGELYMIKVIPRVGFPYYLVKNRGRLNAHPGEPGSNVSVPMWRILEF
ncbi:MAG TPA: DUF2782 domain-containing protein [Nitrosomonas sp.]|uniref:DUF2782 domain-containing protein n=1 Tax=Nitrosomonas sp. TaxID=42353 RepID=UPI000E992560|nr:DUF2782 domain-containing protein [Nitrosomonas sp.]HBV22097.1 DUF2782 domain-containing protein [Nitrosomonas sp.]HNP25762.1 DUF2782 domain-containing protein [Nitrosomonas sp.]